MKERNNLIGHWIQLLVGSGSKQPLSIDKVVSIDDQVLICTNGQYVLSDEDFRVLEDPLFDFKLDVGITATMKRDITSFKKGDKIIIEDFLDDQKTKIITKGLTPGGWINKKDVIIDINLSKYRYKTYIECCVEFGTNWQYHNCYISNKLFSNFGRSLDKLPITFDSYNNSLVQGGTVVWGIYITEKPHSKVGYKLQVINKEEFARLKPYFTTSSYSAYREGIKDLYGIDFNKLNIHVDLKRMNVEQQIKYIAEREYIQTNDGKNIDIKFLKVVEDIKEEKETNRQVENIEASSFLEKAAKKQEKVDDTVQDLVDKINESGVSQKASRKGVRMVENPFNSLDEASNWAGLQQEMKTEQMKYNIAMANGLSEDEWNKLNQLKEEEKVLKSNFEKLLKKDKDFYGNDVKDPWEY